MSVTTNSNGDKVKHQITLTGRRLLSLAALQGLLLGACGFLTYHFAVVPTQLANSIAAKSFVMAKQQQQVEAIAGQARGQMSVLAQRMGILTARMNRIDALGQRLATTAKFDEFDFSAIPSVGGPEQYSAMPDNSEFTALFNQMDQLLVHLDDQQQQLSVLETVMLSHHIEEDSRITGRPVQKGWLSSYYGMRSDPFTGRSSMHKGVDFASKEGSAVIATGAGVVSWASKRAGYGLLVEIDHGAGLKTRYGHSKQLLVKVGDVVTKGEEIALVGNTGRSTGPHVHYEVLKRDQTIDPRKYIYR
ncbi:MAG: M23 family metallopeptidase [Gammaproteobacteria bacterium]|nr:M23 family metallopeptidase [Gammaproteobacteria bacterium]